MQVRIYSDGLSSQSIFDIMHSMLDAELYLCILSFREDDYEWVIGPDVWNRIASNIQEKIFDIEVTISRDKLDTIILKKKKERRNEMERRSYVEGLTSRSILKMMHSMLSAEEYKYRRSIREDDYEWVIGINAWTSITSKPYLSSRSNNNGFNNISLVYTNYSVEPIYKIFGIEVIISKNERNTIILRNKIERRNEMPVEGVSYFDYSNLFIVKTRFIPAIKNVIFNEPATIVFWEDGSKTVVKCQDGDIYDPEKGLAMAISKKALGNHGNYCNEFKEWLPEENEEG